MNKLIEIGKTIHWCNSCGNKFDNYLLTIRLSEDVNGLSFVLCKKCLDDLDKLIRRL